MANGESTALNNTSSPGLTMERWEMWLAFAASAILLAAVVWHFLLNVTYAATMIEYVFKFLPALTDGGWASIFDFNGMGDPRPRLATTFFTFLNVKLRQFALAHTVMHPAFGINWLLYPLDLLILYLVARRLCGAQRVAIMTVLLYAASPALLDTLTNYYVPAKPLINLFMLLAIYGGCLMFPNPNSNLRSLPWLGALMVFCSGLLGLLSDETGVFIFLCTPVLFCHAVLSSSFSRFTKALFAGSLTASFLVYIVSSFIVLPAVNSYLGQVPVDLWGVAHKGVYRSTFGQNQGHVKILTTQYAPFSLLETIVSVHGVPHRHVTARWTSSCQIRHFWRWKLTDQLGLYFYLTCLGIPFLRLRKDPAWYGLNKRLFAAFAVFVVVEAFLLGPHLCFWITETNYYAALASLFVALTVGHILGNMPSTRWTSITAWICLCYFLCVQYSNYLETSQRHYAIFLDPAQLTWSDLSHVRDQVCSGDFESVAQQHPFQTRLFSYAFELQAGLEERAGHKIDILPMSATCTNLFKYFDLPSIADPGTENKDIPRHASEPDLIAEGCPRYQGQAIIDLVANSTLRGRSGCWGYVRIFDGTGKVRQKYWREGLMRAWADTGKIETAGNDVILSLAACGAENITNVYERQGVFYGFDGQGRHVTTFVRPSRSN